MKIPPALLEKLISVIEEIFEASFFKGSSIEERKQNISLKNPLETILEPSTICEVGGDSKGGRARVRQVKNESSSKTAPNEIFQKFYVEYPKHVGRGAAVKALERALKKAPLETIVAGAKMYAEKCRKEGTEIRFICLPSTWLNQERWLDEDGINESPDAILARLETFRGALKRVTAEGDRARIDELNKLISSDFKRLDAIRGPRC